MQYFKNHRSLVMFAFAALAALSGCKLSDLTSGTKGDIGLINGQETTEHPEVVEIRTKFSKGAGSCTATFITDQILITAAHCVVDKNERGGPVNNKVTDVASGAVSIRGFAHPNYVSDVQLQTFSSHDIAIIEFPKGTGKNFGKITTSPINNGEEILQVGYGCTAFNPQTGETSGNGAKRQGVNNIDKKDRGVLTTSGASAGASGKDVINCPGDSGGPIFRKGTNEIVGLASTVGGADASNFQSNYAEVQSEFSQSFMGSLSKENITVPGIDPKYIGGQAKGADGKQPDPQPTTPPGPKPNPTNPPGPNPNPTATPAPSGSCVCGPDQGNCTLKKNGQIVASTPLFQGETCDQAMCQKYFSNTLNGFCKS
jgi:V8-like Glu-specific endopeptidase